MKYKRVASVDRVARLGRQEMCTEVWRGVQKRPLELRKYGESYLDVL